MSASNLISLEERMEGQLRAFGYYPQNPDEERGVSLPRTAVRVGAGGAALGGAAYGAKKLNNAVINRYGVVDDYGNMVARKGMYGDAARAAGKEVSGVSKDVARKGLKKTARGAGLASNALHQSALRGSGVTSKVAGTGSELLRKASSGLRKVAKTFSRAEADLIVDLAARIGEMEMELEHEFSDPIVQRDPAAIQYVGQSMNGYFGGREALLARDKFSQAGHVYRKRDAAADSGKGALTATGLTAAGVGSAYLGGKGLIHAAKSGVLPKGAVRKYGVKAAQVAKKLGRSPAAAVGTVIGAAALSQLAGLRVQRKSAEARLARRQAQG